MFACFAIVVVVFERDYSGAGGMLGRERAEEGRRGRERDLFKNCLFKRQNCRERMG